MQRDFGSGNPFVDIIKFNKQYGFDQVDEALLGKDFLKFRMLFVIEELKETIKAFDEGNAEEFIDGQIDMIQVLMGNFVFMGVNLPLAWGEVYDCNMQKTKGVNSTRQGSAGIDLFKPEGWIKPDHGGNHGRLDKVLWDFPTQLYDEIFGYEREVVVSVDDVMTIVSEKIHTLRTQEIEDYEQRWREFIAKKMKVNVEDAENVMLRFLDFLALTQRKPIEFKEFDKLKGGAIRVFEQCIKLQVKKSADYSSIASEITRADYFPFGLRDIFYMVHTKGLRIKSLIEKLQSGGAVNNESLEDSLIDDIIYTAFAIEWLRNEMPGQSKWAGTVFDSKLMPKEGDEGYIPEKNDDIE